MPKRPSQADYLADFAIEKPSSSSTPSSSKSDTPKRSRAATPRQPQREAEPGARERTTLYLRRDLYAEAKGAATFLGSRGEQPGNVSELVEHAVERELERLRKLHHGGRPFPPYLGGLPGGRPRRR